MRLPYSDPWRKDSRIQVNGQQSMIMSFPPVDTFVVGGDLYEIMMRDYTIVYNIQILVSPAAMDLNLCFEKL